MRLIMHRAMSGSLTRACAVCRHMCTKPTQLKRVAIVTGSSSGIGQGIAVELARTGYAITLHGRNVAGVEKTAQMCVEAGCKQEEVLCLHGNLTEDDVLKDIPALTFDKFGRIDALVNNAGEAFHPDKMALFDPKLLDRLIDVNLRAPIILANQVIPALKETKGSILNISSVSANNHRMFIYGITKAALEHFTMTLALELAPSGVRVNCIKPGAIMTPVWGRFGTLTDERSKQLENSLTHYFHPLRRLTSQEDINHAVTFMLSEKSDFITGAIIPVAGGAHLPFDGRVLQHLENTDGSKRT